MAKKKKSNFRNKVASDSRKQKTQGASYGYLNLPKGVSVFSAEPGNRMRFDIMPYQVTDKKHPDRDEEMGIAVPGELWYKRPFKIHRNIGVENDAVVCRASVGAPCPVCEYRAKRIKEGADKEEIDALKQSIRNLYVVIPVNHKKMEAIPHIWDVSQYLFQNLLNEELEEDEDNAVFPDLEEGLTLKVRFDSKQFGKGNPFAEASRIDFFDRDEKYDESILDDIPNLDEVLSVMSYKELEAKLFELDPEDVADSDEELEEEEEVPQGTSARKRKKGKKEDEEESPKPSRTRKIKPDEDEEEEEDEDEEEESAEFEPDQGFTTCVACGGTGKNSKGRTCLACNGAGQIPDEDEEEEEEPAPTKATRSKGKSSKKQDENKCPHGHTFGKDCDEYDDCDECEKWDDCCDEQ